VLSQGDHVVAIPGTTRLTNLETNLGALDCRLTDEERGVLNNLADKVLGDRYSPDEMAGVNL
jgi:aryl-alcohol dehydrogenase-like predicted oxidoreductase